MQSCRGILAAGLANQVLPGATIDQFMHVIDDAVSDMAKDGVSISSPEGADVLSKAVTDRFIADAKRAQLVAAFDLQTITSKVEWITEFYPDAPDLGLKALIVGEAKANFGSRSSVDLVQKTTAQNFRGDIIQHLGKAELLNHFIVGGDDFEKGVFLAARRKAAGKALDGLPEESIKVANILEQLSLNRRNEGNRAGMNIGELAGRVTRQTHDTWRVRKAHSIIKDKTNPSFFQRANSLLRKGATEKDADSWVEYVWDVLDHEATFPANIIKEGDDAKRVFLYKVYDTISSGDSTPGTGKGRPASALERDRVLHFTEEGEFEYMRTFGAGSLKDTVFAEVDDMGFRLGLANTLGLNPKSNLQAIVSGLRTRGNADSIARLDKYASGFDEGDMRNTLGRHFLTVSGATNKVVSDIGALIGSSLRTFEFVTKLGFATLSSINDVANMAADLQGLQGSYSLAMRDAMLAPLEGLVKGEKRAYAEAMGFGLDTLIGASFSRFGAIDSPSGMMSKGMSQYFKLNLLGPWTDAARRGHYIAVSRLMGMEFQKDIISPRYIKALREYGISEPEITMVKKHLKMSEVEGTTFFDSNKIKDISPENFEINNIELERIVEQLGGVSSGDKFDALVSNFQLRKRDQLTTKFSSFFIDRNDMAVLVPDAATRSYAQQGKGRGSLLREVTESFMQFKQFPVTMMNVLMRRHVANRELGALTFHIGALTGLGAVSMVLKDMAKFREPFVPQTKLEGGKFMLASFMNGGAAGLYGDFILGEASTYSDKILRLAGPVANDALEYSTVVKDQMRYIFTNDTYEGEVGSSLWKAIRNDIPTSNLFYTKAMLDYGVLYWIAETLSPGFLTKQEAGLKKSRSGRGSMVTPRDVVPYGGLRSL